MEGIQPTYQLGGSDGLGFGGSGIWLFAILALFFFGNNGAWGGNAGRNVATQDDLNFSRLENQVRANADLTERKTDGIVNGLSSLGYEMAQQFGATNTQMATGFCSTDKAILESRYLNAQAIAESNASITAQITALSQKMDADKISALQQRINQLELQQATGNVVRYPSGFTYATSCNPFCNCCNNGNI